MTCLGTLTPWTPSPAVVAAVQAAVGEQPDYDAAGMQDFNAACGVQGLCRVDGDQLHLIAILAPDPGQGAFRRFIESAKREFAAIYVWEVWNPWLGTVLDRYGFTPTRRTEPNGERVSGYVWRARAGEATHA